LRGFWEVVEENLRRSEAHVNQEFRELRERKRFAAD
jgi:hypothetical protein